MPTIDLTDNEHAAVTGGDPARHRGRQVPPRPAPRTPALGAGQARNAGTEQPPSAQREGEVVSFPRSAAAG